MDELQRIFERKVRQLAGSATASARGGFGLSGSRESEIARVVALALRRERVEPLTGTGRVSIMAGILSCNRAAPSVLMTALQLEQLGILESRAACLEGSRPLPMLEAGGQTAMHHIGRGNRTDDVLADFLLAVAALVGRLPAYGARSRQASGPPPLLALGADPVRAREQRSPAPSTAPGDLPPSPHDSTFTLGPAIRQTVSCADQQPRRSPGASRPRPDLADLRLEPLARVRNQRGCVVDGTEVQWSRAHVKEARQEPGIVP